MFIGKDLSQGSRTFSRAYLCRENVGTTYSAQTIPKFSKSKANDTNVFKVNPPFHHQLGYSLYYLVLCVSSNVCALYFYYFASPIQILRVIATPTQLVPATTSHSPPPLKSQQLLSCSVVDCGNPVPAGANVRPSHPHAHIQIYHHLDCSLPQDTSFWFPLPKQPFLCLIHYRPLL